MVWLSSVQDSSNPGNPQCSGCWSFSQNGNWMVGSPTPHLASLHPSSGSTPNSEAFANRTKQKRWIMHNCKEFSICVVCVLLMSFFFFFFFLWLLCIWSVQFRSDYGVDRVCGWVGHRDLLLLQKYVEATRKFPLAKISMIVTRLRVLPNLSCRFCYATLKVSMSLFTTLENRAFSLKLA